jgi:DNA topoisomerase-1
VVDYLIGMEVSRLIWRFDCRSAGRLQSTALRILAERERAREAFIPEKFWTVRAEYGGGLNAVLGGFEVLEVGELDTEDGVADEVRLAPMRFDRHAEAERVLRDLRSARHVVEAVEKRPRTRNPPPPLTTSDLLATASSRLGCPSEKTSQLAQSLFEKGAITYIRTDSSALADDAILDIRGYLGAHHGRMLPDEPILAAVAPGAQAAHEAIRPTKMTRVPRAEMGFEESALYDLVFVRTLCSQAKPAVMDRTLVTIEPMGHPSRLSAHWSAIREAGWTELDPEITIANTATPDIQVGQELQLCGADLAGHKTRSPPRFTERSLIRFLEHRGVGRPSTYVEMLRKLRDRGYVETRGTELVPLELGSLADELVTVGFDLLTQEDFTANTEKVWMRSLPVSSSGSSSSKRSWGSSSVFLLMRRRPSPRSRRSILSLTATRSGNTEMHVPSVAPR